LAEVDTRVCFVVDLNTVSLQWSTSGQFYREIFTDQMIISKDDDYVDFKLCNEAYNTTQHCHQDVSDDNYTQLSTL